MAKYSCVRSVWPYVGDAKGYGAGYRCRSVKTGKFVKQSKCQAKCPVTSYDYEGARRGSKYNRWMSKRAGSAPRGAKPLRRATKGGKLARAK